MLSLPDIEDAAAIVYAAMPPTPQYAWPLLAIRTGCEVWVKHLESYAHRRLPRSGAGWFTWTD